jgi:hypothetical protein
MEDNLNYMAQLEKSNKNKNYTRDENVLNKSYWNIYNDYSVSHSFSKH